jgi:cytolysin (calcineurin-like family phosphatase)
VIEYKRKDGVGFQEPYLPAGYDKVKKKITAFIWAYPAEFKDKNSAGQNNQNNEFTLPYYGSFVYWVTRGYVVLDDASFLLLVRNYRTNDNFISQLVDNAEAARQRSRCFRLYR